MRARWRLLAIVGLLGCTVSGCGSTSDLDTVRSEAAAVLELWERVLAAAPAGSLVPVVGVDDLENTLGDPTTYVTPPGLAGGSITLAPGSGTSPPADAGGLSVVDAETAARAAWQFPDSRPANGTSVLHHPRWERRPMLTTDGPVDVPVWRFDVERSQVTVTAVAVDVRYLVTPRGMPEDSPARRARLVAERVVEFSYAGAPEGCGKDFETHAVEGAYAVTVAVETITAGFGVGSCGSAAEFRTMTVELPSPLGNRVLVGPDGQAVFVADAPR